MVVVFKTHMQNMLAGPMTVGQKSPMYQSRETRDEQRLLC